MRKSLLLFSMCALPFVASCKSTKSANAAAPDVQAATEEVEEALDPNDPNVMVCPVTGIMQRVEPGDEHGGMEGHGEH